MAREMLIFALAASAICCVALILLMKPLLVRYALARPNARSSHKVPTPQGGGIAILAATILVAGIAIRWLDLSGFHLLLVAAVSVAFGVAGTMDDIKPMPALPRLAFQFVLLLVVFSKPERRLFPDVPIIVEWTFTMLAGLWFVNLVNFMDGLDWITIATMVPITTFIAALGWFGFLPTQVALISAALCGALIGFAPFNKPVAKLFLGDVGSLSIGFLVGWLLWQLAGTGALAAAILLPLYHLADATITLLRRLARREKVWEAHRSHFYQQATVNGFSVMAVSAHVFVLNLALAALAAWTIVSPTPSVQVVALAAGCILVGWLLRRFATKQTEQAA